MYLKADDPDLPAFYDDPIINPVANYQLQFLLDGRVADEEEINRLLREWHIGTPGKNPSSTEKIVELGKKNEGLWVGTGEGDPRLTLDGCLVEDLEEEEAYERVKVKEEEDLQRYLSEIGVDAKKKKKSLIKEGENENELSDILSAFQTSILTSSSNYLSFTLPAGFVPLLEDLPLTTDYTAQGLSLYWA
jgi:hypothetical protein